MARRRRSQRGDGSVFYDRDARSWVAVVSLGTVNGKRVRRKVRAATERDALAAREGLLRSVRHGVASPRQTLDQYLAEWLPAHARSIRQSTVTSYEGHIRNHIGPLLGGIELSRLRSGDVRRLVGDLDGRGLSAGTIHLVVRTLSAALNVAVADGLIDRNPTLGVRLPRIDREPVRALTDDEADAILEAVAGSWVAHPVRVWLGSGLRRGEVLGLDQRDIADGYVRVRVSKTRVRAVPVTGDAMEALREALAAAPRRGPNEPIFFSPRTGDRMRGDSITHALPRILERAGLGHLTPHALRHGVASLMLAQGTPMRLISEQLGHASPQLTSRIYAHVVPQHQAEAIQAIGRVRKVRAAAED